MSARAWALCLALLLPVAACGQRAGADRKEEKMPDSPAQILESSQDGADLAVAALELARSAQPADHRTLQRYLQSAAFLSRLDSQEDYKRSRRTLRIAAVLRALAENEAPSARALIVTLAQTPEFVEFPTRTELLLEASAVVRPEPPELARFWAQCSDPDDVYISLLVDALLRNGSPLALDLFERMMADARYEEDEKISWLRLKVLPHRNELPVLQSCERLLDGRLPEGLRAPLVEALFDWRPEWYRPSNNVRRPRLEDLTPDGRDQLRKIGRQALAGVALTPQQRQVVEGTLKSLDGEVPR